MISSLSKRTKEIKFLLILFFGAIIFLASSINIFQINLAKASDIPTVDQITLTGKGSASVPYEGYVVRSQNTWVDVNVPCLFGGGNQNESAPNSYSEIGFKVRVSGKYKFSITAQTYPHYVKINSSLISEGAVLIEPTEVAFNAWSTSTVNAFEADLQAGRLYIFKISGSDVGYDLYVRNIKLDYISQSEVYPIPKIVLDGITEDVVIEEKGNTYALPEALVNGVKSDDVYIEVFAPDGSLVITKTKWSDLSDKSFALEDEGNYLVKYQTNDEDYASFTYAVQVPYEPSSSDIMKINAKNFYIKENYAINTSYGIGGSNPQATGSLSFPFETYSTLKNLDLNITITALSEKKDNAVSIKLDDNAPVIFTFEQSSQLTTYNIGSIGKLNGTETSSGLVSRITITGLTEGGNLTLNNITAKVNYEDTELEILSESFANVYNNYSDAEITGTFMVTTNGLLGFSSNSPSQADYKINMLSGGEYFVILKYYRMSGFGDSEVVLSCENEDIFIELDNRAGLLSTPEAEYDAYKINLPAGPNILSLKHSKGAGYFVSEILLSNDLVAPTFTLISEERYFDGFVDEDLTLPYGNIQDNDPNAHFLIEIISDNASKAVIKGSGIQSDPFVFNATEPGEYTLKLTAADSVNNLSESVNLVIFVSESNIPVISVDVSPITIRSGFAFVSPTPTATYKGNDVSQNIRVTIKDALGNELISSKPVIQSSIILKQKGQYTAIYSCEITDGEEVVQAHDKEIPITVIATSYIDGASNNIVLSNGFYAEGAKILHPGDNAFAQADSFSFSLDISKTSDYTIGFNMDLYSSSYTLYYQFDNGRYYKFTATSGTNPVTAYADEKAHLEEGKHTLKILGATVGGDAWIRAIILKDESGAQKIFTAADIISSDYTSQGDVRYSGQQTLGRVNLNPNPTISYTVTTGTAGWYNVDIKYARTSTSENIPLLNLIINSISYNVRLDSNNTSEQTISGAYYFKEGENTISLEGVSSRAYSINSIEINLNKAEDAQMFTLSANAPSKLKVLIGETFDVYNANVSNGDNENILMEIRFNDVVFYSGTAKDMSIETYYEGQYSIKYTYIDPETNKYASPVTYNVLVKEMDDDEDIDDNDNIDNGGEKGKRGCKSYVSSVLTILILGAGFAVNKRYFR